MTWYRLSPSTLGARMFRRYIATANDVDAAIATARRPRQQPTARATEPKPTARATADTTVAARLTRARWRPNAGPNRAMLTNNTRPTPVVDATIAQNFWST